MTVPAVAEKGLDWLEKKGGWGVALILVGALMFQQHETQLANATRDAAIAQMIEKQSQTQLQISEKLALMTAKLDQMTINLTALNAEIRVTQSIIRGETKLR